MKFRFLKDKFFLHHFFIISTLTLPGSFFIARYWRAIHEVSLQSSIIFFIFLLITYSFFITFGIILNRKSKLSSLNYNNFLIKSLLPGVIGGLAITTLLSIINGMFFPQTAVPMHYILNNLFERPFHGFAYGVIPEIVLRLFLLSFIYFILKSIFKKKSSHLLIWISIMIVALLPSTITFILSNKMIFYKDFIENIIGGMIFGYLFIYKTFYSAAIAHFILAFLLFY
jgi:hypothetical protein